jgi:hypothetical protein
MPRPIRGPPTDEKQCARDVILEHGREVDASGSIGNCLDMIPTVGRFRALKVISAEFSGYGVARCIFG